MLLGVSMASTLIIPALLPGLGQDSATTPNSKTLSRKCPRQGRNQAPLTWQLEQWWTSFVGVQVGEHFFILVETCANDGSDIGQLPARYCFLFSIRPQGFGKVGAAVAHPSIGFGAACWGIAGLESPDAASKEDSAGCTVATTAMQDIQQHPTNVYIKTRVIARCKVLHIFIALNKKRKATQMGGLSKKQIRNYSAASSVAPSASTASSAASSAGAAKVASSPTSRTRLALMSR